MSDDGPEQAAQPQPMFNLPAVVVGLVGVLIAIHMAATWVLDGEGQSQLTLWFAFIPIRWTAGELLPGGALPLFWTPVTHAFLHAGWEHVLINAAWLAIFGTPVAQRYGPVAFLIAFLVTAIGGALAFALLSPPILQVLVGASGGVAGLTGVAIRFIFQPLQTAQDPETGEIIVLGRRLATYRDLLRNNRARIFIIIWVGLNALMPFLPIFMGGMEVQIAWEAHLGGFFAGLLIAPLFERRPPPQSQE